MATIAETSLHCRSRPELESGNEMPAGPHVGSVQKAADYEKNKTRHEAIVSGPTDEQLGTCDCGWLVFGGLWTTRWRDQSAAGQGGWWMHRCDRVEDKGNGEYY